MSAALAMAKKCSTALVEPPKIVTNRTAFSKDFFEMISEGLMSFSRSTRMACPAAMDSDFFSDPVAGFEAL